MALALPVQVYSCLSVCSTSQSEVSLYTWQHWKKLYSLPLGGSVVGVFRPSVVLRVAERDALEAIGPYRCHETGKAARHSTYLKDIPGGYYNMSMMTHSQPNQVT